MGEYIAACVECSNKIEGNLHYGDLESLPFCQIYLDHWDHFSNVRALLRTAWLSLLLSRNMQLSRRSEIQNLLLINCLNELAILVYLNDYSQTVA